MDVQPTLATITIAGATATPSDLPDTKLTKRAIDVGIPFAHALVQSAALQIDDVDCTFAP